MSNKSKLELKESSTKKPGGVTKDTFSVILDPNNLFSRPLAVTTTRSTINIDGFNIGNPLGFTSTSTTTSSTTSSTSTTTTTRKAVAPAGSSWTWTDADNQQPQEESSEKSPEVPEVPGVPGVPLSIDLSNLITVNADKTDPASFTTTETTTTESLSDWYQDFFSNLLAANEKKNPRTTTTTTTTVATTVTDHHEHHDDQEHHEHHDEHHDEDHFQQLASVKKSIPAAPEGNLGLSITDSGLDSAARQFVKRNNQVGFDLYRKLLEQEEEGDNENLVFSPVSASSSLSMIFLGARGQTSRQINDLLALDQNINLNPHLLYKNISDSLAASPDSSASKDILVSKVGGV